MNLAKKKALAARTFGVGKSRVVFLASRIAEVKEAITKQDIRDLHRDGAILIKEIKGRRTVNKQSSRSAGNVRKKINKRKREYVLTTRKFRSLVKEMKKQGNINQEQFIDIRKKIKNRIFKSKAQLKEHMGSLK